MFTNLGWAIITLIGLAVIGSILRIGISASRKPTELTGRNRRTFMGNTARNQPQGTDYENKSGAMYRGRRLTGRFLSLTKETRGAGARHVELNNNQRRYLRVMQETITKLDAEVVHIKQNRYS